MTAWLPCWILLGRRAGAAGVPESEQPALTVRGNAGSGKEGRQQPWDDGEAGWDVRGIIVKECCTQSVAPRQKGLIDTFLNALPSTLGPIFPHLNRE